MEQIDFIDSHVPGEDEEQSAAEVRTQLRPLSRGRALNKEVTTNWGTSLLKPLLVSLQEQLPSELSPVAGDVERTWSSRYSNHQAHMSAPYSTAPGTSPSPDKGLSCPVFCQAGGACRGGEAASRHFAVVAGAGEAAATATEWGMGIPQEGQVKAWGCCTAGRCKLVWALFL